MNNLGKIGFVFLFMTGMPALLSAQTIVTSKHNLSASSSEMVKATSESEICIFCHTPHSSAPKSPLWNRNISGTSYILYNSSTLEASLGQPDGSSILCLSCHDGTIALGDVLSRRAPINMSKSLKEKNILSTDLSNDHPVSFTYDASLAVADNHLKTPPLLFGNLDANSKMQCTSCHDPHKEDNPYFLLATTEYSDLCFNCHDNSYWKSSSHSTSTKIWNGSGDNPWSHLESAYSNVSQNACANCHDQHNAEGKTRLLKDSYEENNCFDCHNGNVAEKNVQADFAKNYRHDVFKYNGIHDPVEGVSTINKHVECVDCHNPHASNDTKAFAPKPNGSNLAVSGVNQSGRDVKEANYTYEICYKCHAGNSWSTPSTFIRQFDQNNVRLEFAPSNPSFHPVVSERNNMEASNNLLYPNRVSSVLYCSDCHSSNESNNSTRGPHGSIYPQILKLQYSTADYTFESPNAYALCYSCHNRKNIISDRNTFSQHRIHIVDEGTSCSICHDAHGVSSTQANSFNGSNLINFRTDIVSPSSSGILRYEDTGMGTGNCYLTCHKVDHNPYSYQMYGR